MKRRLIALLLCIAMIGSMTVYAVGDEDTTPVCTCGTVTDEHTSECALYVAPEACAECGATEGHLDTCSQYVAPEACAECGATEGHLDTCSQYEAPEALVEEEQEEESIEELEEEPVEDLISSVAEQLLATESLIDFRGILMAEENFGSVLSFTVDEIEMLMSHVEELYAAIASPSEDDTYYYEEMLETLTYLPAMECPECGEFGTHAEDCVRNIQTLPSSGTVGKTEIKSNQTWNLNGDITLTGTITIKSGYTLKIYNDSATRKIKRGSNFTGDMFYVENGATLHINGTGVGGGCYGNWESAIVIDGNANYNATGQIIDCCGKLSLRDTVLCNNNGYNPLWLGSSGEGEPVDIYHYTTVEITRSKIENCRANDSAGIRIEGSTPAGYTVEIWDSMIYNCNSADGSAIYFSGGGQAEVLMRTCVVDDCDQFTGVEGQYGGALRTNGNGRYKFTMQDSVVRNCHSWKFGGGVYWNAAGSGAELNIIDCQFLNNSAAEMGGGMFLEGSNMTITASSGTPSAPVLTGMPGNLTGTLIEGNNAPNGGGISYKCYSNDAIVQIPTTVANFNENVIFRNNTGEHGPALAYNLHDTHNYPTGATFKFNINGATFTNNEGTGYGGAIYVRKCRTDYVLEVNFNSGTITDNSAKNGGAIAIVTDEGVTTGGTFNMKGGTLSNNTASADGGALYVQKGNFNLSGGTVTNNEALNGGAACLTDGSFNMSAGELKSNNATANGGAVYVTGGNFTMSNGTMSGNSATQNGGAVYVNGGEFTMQNGVMSGNNSDGNGGAAFIKGGDALFEYGFVNENTAVNGGAVYMDGNASTTFTMHSGFMNNNEATNDGGAIFANGGIIYIGLEDCKKETGEDYVGCTDHGSGRTHPQINGNEAGNSGGGISIDESGVVHFYCGNATDNEALYKGVGKNVFMQGGTFNIYDATNIGVPRDPDLVIVGGILNNMCEEKEYVRLYYYESNKSTSTNMEGLAEYEEIINLPDGEYFFKAPEGHIFVGWTAQGAATGNLDYTYVRHKEQYVASGNPVEILDHESTATDDTAANTNRLFDGTNDKTIHLYALWAPVKNQISYLDGMTNAVIENEAKEYTFSRESATTVIQPVLKPGYDLVGWYIYQDNDQNANWNANADDKTYEQASKTYIALTDRNSVMNLETGYSNFGNITLVAEYVPAYTDLLISKTGWIGDLDENQSYIFRITGTPTNPKLSDIDMTVVIHGDGSTLIKQMPVGSYRVQEITNWSWRYTPGDDIQNVELVDSTVTGKAEFANKRTNEFWLSGDSWCKNLWNGTGITATHSQQRTSN